MARTKPFQTNTTADRDIREAVGRLVGNPAPYSDCQNETAAKPSSPFEDVEQVAGQVGDLVARLNRMADALCGAMPEGECEAIRPNRSGLFGITADRADSIACAVDRGHEALRRIEAQLP